MQIAARIVGQFSRVRFYKSMMPIVVTIIYVLFLVLFFGLLFSSPQHNMQNSVTDERTALQLLHVDESAPTASANVLSSDNRLQISRDELETGIRAMTTGEGRGKAARIMLEKFEQLQTADTINGVDIVE